MHNRDGRDEEAFLRQNLRVRPRIICSFLNDKIVITVTITFSDNPATWELRIEGSAGTLAH